MRLTGILFFVFLAAQIGLRWFRPEPTPDWYRLLVIATAVGVISCLALTVLAERRRRGPTTSPATDPAVTPPRT